MSRRTILLLAISSSLAALPTACGADLAVWAVDPLIKVFRDAPPREAEEAIAEVARGEHATLQVVVRCDEPIEGLEASIDGAGLRHADGDATLPVASVRFAGYVPVTRPTPTPSSDRLRPAPADYPDPLLEECSIDVAPDSAQPIWITVPVPMDARPGAYLGQLHLSGIAGGEPASAAIPLRITVYDVVVGPSRLWVTNWYFTRFHHLQNEPEPYSEEFWLLLGRFARNMAEHRQNVAWVSPLDLARCELDAGGRMIFDFSRFDRWVKVFMEAGVIGRIEGRHIGARSGPWVSPFVVRILRPENGRIISATADPASPQAEAFYRQFLPALVAHLKERGWLDRYLQHLADEPIEQNIESYRAMAELVHTHAPELRIIEACHTKDLIGAIDVWVPQLNYWHRDADYYAQRRAEGEEVWFYTCMFPQGEYANRFIELPLIKTRLLHWINYRYGATGYLHWGYNAWRDDVDPFANPAPDHPAGRTILPAGDAWIVYPGKEGPLDSIRFEAMRDGIADYELLCMLGDKDPHAARRLVARHILDFDRYDCNVPAFRATRRELLTLLADP
jgi:hypothetical protein